MKTFNQSEYEKIHEKMMDLEIKFFYPDVYLHEGNRTLDKAFAISNEQLPEIFEPLNLFGKKVVTVGASGDQALNAILQGCNDVTVVDGNSFTEPYMEYKIALIKMVDFETFKRMFIKEEMFDWRVYAKLSHLLTPQTRQFWDSIMLEVAQNPQEGEITQRSIIKRMFFVNEQDKHSKFYTSEDVYNKLQARLKTNDVNIKYLEAEFKKFPTVLKDKYDLIFLSNIYFFYQEKTEEFKQIVKTLYDKKLIASGKMVVNYEFNVGLAKSPTNFAGFNLEVQEVGRIFKGKPVKDAVWILNKPKTQTKTNDDLCK